MHDILTRHRRVLGYALIGSAIVYTVAAVSYGLSRPSVEWRQLWILYVAPLTIAAPLWLRLRLYEPQRHPWPPRAVDASVVAICIFRFFRPELLPFSGHTLFLSYSALSTRRRWYLALAAILLVETTIFKFLVWGDASSWWIGLALGTALAAVQRWLGGGPAESAT